MREITDPKSLTGLRLLVLMLGLAVALQGIILFTVVLRVIDLEDSQRKMEARRVMKNELHKFLPTPVND